MSVNPTRPLGSKPSPPRAVVEGGVDYAQELRSASKGAQYSPEQNQAECARVLVGLARRLDIAVIVGSQLTEGREGMKTRTKWSWAWVEKAGWVLTIAQNEKGGRSIQVPYSRFGPQSDRSKTIGIAVGFVKDRVAFSQIFGSTEHGKSL